MNTPKINDYVHLTDLDYPHIRVYRNGTIFDELTNHWIGESDYRGVWLSKHDGSKPQWISKSRLYGYCFLAPWAQRIQYLYRQLSFLGFPNYVAVWTGKIFGFHKMRYLQEDISGDGYPECVLVDPSGTMHYFKTHRLIALSFVPNPENKDTVNHIDGNKLNNCADNLEWLYNWENMDHALKTGLKHSVMSDELVHSICKRLSDGSYDSLNALAAEFGVQRHNVWDILDGCHYRISMQYPNIPYLPSKRHVPNEFK